MTKDELITKVSNRMGLTEPVAKVCVNSVIEMITKALAKGERVEIREFFSFEPRWRDPVMKRNPMTGEPAPIKGKYIPFGKQSKSWNKRMNQQP